MPSNENPYVITPSYQWVNSGILDSTLGPGPMPDSEESEDHYEAIDMPSGPGLVDKVVKKMKTKDVTLDGTKVADAFNIGSPKSISMQFGSKFLEHNPHLISPTPYIFKTPKLLVGVEVEVENVQSIDPGLLLCFWDMTEDGSLRNNGREFRTWACPLLYVEPALRQLFYGLNHDVDFSKRCSIHVHIDVRQLTLSQLVGMMLTYTAVENLLFRFASLERRRNIFCVPVTETRLLTNTWADPINMLMGINQIWQKYSALNMLPIQKFGTIEFRQMPGTANVKQLLIWIDLLSRLRVYAYKTPLKTIIETISSLNTSSRYRQFVESVFEELTVFLDTTSLLQEMEKPVSIVKNSTVTNLFHQWVANSKTKDSSFNKIFKALEFEDLSTSQLKCLEYLHKKIGVSPEITETWKWLQVKDSRKYCYERWNKHMKHIFDGGADPFYT